MKSERRDQSALDRQYFVTGDTYNCPYCRRGSVGFGVASSIEFDWNQTRGALAVIVVCVSCNGRSFHLTNHLDLVGRNQYGRPVIQPKYASSLDKQFFFHQPSSFFTLDERIPRKVRDLLQEASESRRSNFLIGASACLRKAIYELLAVEQVPKTEDDGKGGARDRHYEDRVRDLKAKREHMDPNFIDVLAHTLELTSDQLHEDSWDGWAPEEFDAVMDATLSVLREMYVVPEERKELAGRTAELVNRMKGRARDATPAKDSSRETVEPAQAPKTREP